MQPLWLSEAGSVCCKIVPDTSQPRQSIAYCRAHRKASILQRRVAFHFLFCFSFPSLVIIFSPKWKLV